MLGAIIAKKQNQANLLKKTNDLSGLSFGLFGIVACISYNLTWRFGIEVMPITLLLLTLGLSAFLIALLAGFIIAQLMVVQENSAKSTLILISDTAGSVIGAMLVGFIMLPYFGLNSTFITFIALAWFTALWALKIAPLKITICVLLSLLVFSLPIAFMKQNSLRTLGFPLPEYLQDNTTIIETVQSPMGVLSVLEISPQNDAPYQMLRIDNIELCMANVDGSDLTQWSEYEIGRFPADIISKQERTSPRVAIVGLGCGFTLAGVLKELPVDATVEVIEINPEMPKMTSLFSSITGNILEDSRVKLKIKDGFKHFMHHDASNTYDVVIIDITWMRDATLTHMFSKEFFLSIKNSLKPDGIFALWGEEHGINNPISQTTFATLQSAFPYISVRDVNFNYIYFASSDNDTLNKIPQSDKEVTLKLQMNSAGAPVNTLDNLVLNRLIFGLNSPLYGINLYKK